MDADCERLKQSLTTIGAELFRFQGVFERAVDKLSDHEKKKYSSQFTWFTKKVYKALDEANLKIIDLTGQEYDAGMAVSPLNLDDFAIDDRLYIEQMVEPIIMEGNCILKTGTVILGRKE